MMSASRRTWPTNSQPCSSACGTPRLTPPTGAPNRPSGLPLSSARCAAATAPATVTRRSRCSPASCAPPANCGLELHPLIAALLRAPEPAVPELDRHFRRRPHRRGNLLRTTTWMRDRSPRRAAAPGSVPSALCSVAPRTRRQGRRRCAPVRLRPVSHPGLATVPTVEATRVTTPSVHATPLAAPQLSRLKSTFGPCLLANHPVNKYLKMNAWETGSESPSRCTTAPVWTALSSAHTSRDLHIPTFHNRTLRQLMRVFRRHRFHVYLTLAFDSHEAVVAEAPRAAAGGSVIA